MYAGLKRYAHVNEGVGRTKVLIEVPAETRVYALLEAWKVTDDRGRAVWDRPGLTDYMPELKERLKREGKTIQRPLQ